MYSPLKMACHRTLTRSDSVSAVSRQPQDYRASHFDDLRHSCTTGVLKASIILKVDRERIRHADVVFFLKTYADVLGNDGRDAAEQAAAFSRSATQSRTSGLRRRRQQLDNEQADVPNVFPLGTKTAPGDVSEG